MDGGQVWPTTGRGGRDDGHADHPVDPGRQAQDRQQERLVTGQELAAPVERDGPGHGR